MTDGRESKWKSRAKDTAAMQARGDGAQPLRSPWRWGTEARFQVFAHTVPLTWVPFLPMLGFRRPLLLHDPSQPDAVSPCHLAQPFRAPGTGLPSRLLTFLAPPPNIRPKIGWAGSTSSLSLGCSAQQEEAMENSMQEGQAHPGSCLDLALAAPPAPLPHTPHPSLDSIPENELSAVLPTHPPGRITACPQGREPTGNGDISAHTYHGGYRGVRILQLRS